MITENEIQVILCNELPEINKELEQLPNRNNIYKTILCFVDFTKELAYTGNLAEVKHCFTLAERMLKDGNKTVKNAIENVYVFSVSSILHGSTSVSKEVNALFNGSLRKEYIHQIEASGI